MGLYGSFLFGEQYYGQGLLFKDYLKVLQSNSRKPLVKVQLQYPNGDIYEEITSSLDSANGSLTNTFQNGIRRTITLTITDPIYKYDISQYSLWINTRFVVSKGFQIGNDTYWIQQGVFINYDPDLISNFSLRTITLNGKDKACLLNGDLGGILEAPYIIQSGSYMKDAIVAILSEVGDTSPLIYDSVYEGYQIPYTMTFNAGDNYFSIINKLAELRSSNAYYNEIGSFCFVAGIEDIDDSLKDSKYSFSKGFDLNYLTGKSTHNFSKIRNYVSVIGQTVDGSQYSATSSITDLSSDVCINFIGQKTMVIIDNNINSIQFCQDRSDFELKKNSVCYLTVSITCQPIIHLDVNQVIDVTDPFLNFDQRRLLIQSITDPYNISNAMSIVCSNVNEIAYTHS